jgi:hypothetical protein
MLDRTISQLGTKTKSLQGGAGFINPKLTFFHTCRTSDRRKALVVLINATNLLNRTRKAKRRGWLIISLWRA